MKTWMLWYGGSSYSVGGYDDIEEFDSLAQAKRIFWYRYENRDGSTPCVTDESEAWLWFKAKPEDNGDLYPDAILSFGPRGGVRLEVA